MVPAASWITAKAVQGMSGREKIWYDEWTPQHEQVYGNKHGPPLARPGNGLGDVWGGSGDVDELHARRHRPNDAAEPLEPEEFEQIESWEEISEYLNELSAKHAFVIGMKYGFRDGTQYRITEIAEIMGVSHQAVSELHQNALAALRNLVRNER